MNERYYSAREKAARIGAWGYSSKLPRIEPNVPVRKPENISRPIENRPEITQPNGNDKPVNPNSEGIWAARYSV